MALQQGERYSLQEGLTSDLPKDSNVSTLLTYSVINQPWNYQHPLPRLEDKASRFALSTPLTLKIIGDIVLYSAL